MNKKQTKYSPAVFLRLYITILLIIIPFVFTVIIYQTGLFQHVPLFMLDQPVFLSIVTIIPHYSYLLSRPLNSLLYFFILSTFVFVYRLFFNNPIIRSMLKFYKNAFFKVIPNLIISIISFTLFCVSLFIRFPYSDIKFHINWLYSYSFPFGLFFLTLALYWTSPGTIKNKIVLKKKKDETNEKSDMFLFLCNFFYSLFILIFVHSLFSIIINASLNFYFLRFPPFLFAAVYILAFLLFMTLLIISLSSIENKKVPYASFFIIACLSLLVFIPRFFIFNHIDNSLSCITGTTPQNISRYIIMDNSFLKHDIQITDFDGDIDITFKASDIIFRRDNYIPIIHTLQNNFIGIDQTHSTGLYLFFDREYNIYHSASDTINAMNLAINDDHHTIISGFDLLHQLTLLKQDGIQNSTLFYRVYKMHDIAIKHDLEFPRRLTRTAISIKNAVDTALPLNTFDISGSVAIIPSVPNIDMTGIDIYVSIMQLHDFNLIIENLNTGVDLSTFWYLSNPHIKVTDNKFLMENILYSGSPYKFILFINDHDNTLKDLKDIKTNLYTINITDDTDKPYNIIVNLYFDIDDSDE